MRRARDSRRSAGARRARLSGRTAGSVFWVEVRRGRGRERASVIGRHTGFGSAMDCACSPPLLGEPLDGIGRAHADHCPRHGRLWDCDRECNSSLASGRCNEVHQLILFVVQVQVLVHARVSCARRSGRQISGQAHNPVLVTNLHFSAAFLPRSLQQTTSLPRRQQQQQQQARPSQALIRFNPCLVPLHRAKQALHALRTDTRAQHGESRVH